MDPRITGPTRSWLDSVYHEFYREFRAREANADEHARAQKLTVEDWCCGAALIPVSVEIACPSKAPRRVRGALRATGNKNAPFFAVTGAKAHREAAKNVEAIRRVMARAGAVAGAGARMYALTPRQFVAGHAVYLAIPPERLNTLNAAATYVLQNVKTALSAPNARALLIEFLEQNAEPSANTLEAEYFFVLGMTLSFNFCLVMYGDIGSVAIQQWDRAGEISVVEVKSEFFIHLLHKSLSDDAAAEETERALHALRKLSALGASGKEIDGLWNA